MNLNSMQDDIAKCCSVDYIIDNEVQFTAEDISYNNDSCTVGDLVWDVSGYDKDAAETLDLDNQVTCVDYTIQRVCNRMLNN